MNNSETLFIKDLKCNFDVEIGRDMLLDFAKDNVDTFVLWSGDSDFASSIEQLIKDDKQIVLCATARKVSSELNELKEKGLKIFEIQKIKEFICWVKELPEDLREKIGNT